MIKYEDSREKLNELIIWYTNNKGSRNEATTRKHLIDKLLTDCLSWKEEDIACELYSDEKYYDYIVGDSRSVFIVEAKKEGIFFELPAGHKDGKYPLKSLCKDNKDIKEALSQVGLYCQNRGVELGIVSNGWQIIIFYATRVDGVPPLEGNAFVFSSLKSMHNNFQVLWDLLSPEGIKKGYKIKELLGDEILILPNKLSSILPNYPGIKNRNTYQADMQNLSELVLEDVNKHESLEKRFLEECYCKSGALSQYALISKKVLKTRYDFLMEEGQKNIDIKSISDNKGITSDFIEIFEYSLSHRPILLIGDVGSGKSTFINNLIKVEADTIFNNAITLKIDLGSQAIFTEDIKRTIINEVCKQLLEKYKIDVDKNEFVRGVYYKALEKRKQSIYSLLYKINNKKAIEKEIEYLEEKISDKFQYLKDCFWHITQGQKKQIIIFLDNCDQRDDNSQQETFLISQEFAEHWPVTIFVSLRPETFHNSIKTGTLSGYHTKAFTISSPKVEEVLEKRLNFARKITKGEIKLIEGPEIKLKKLDELLEILQYSLRTNKQLLEFIENISNGNIRQAIDMVKNFLGSGHVNTEEILEKNEKNLISNNCPYLISVHQFLRAIIYGDYIFFDPNRSIVTNIFDVRSYDRKEHFLTPFLLGILNAHLNTSQNNGFLETQKVFTNLQRIGYTVKQIEEVLEFSLSKKLVERSSRGKETKLNTVPTMIRLTSIGIYHLCNLCKFFTYIDAILVDVPIFNEETKRQLKDVDSITDRLYRAKIFIDYLNKEWEETKNFKNVFDWNKIYDAICEDIEKIQTTIAMFKKTKVD